MSEDQTFLDPSRISLDQLGLSETPVTILSDLSHDTYITSIDLAYAILFLDTLLSAVKVNC